jgi:hypothetical protein
MHRTPGSGPFPDGFYGAFGRQIPNRLPCGSTQWAKTIRLDLIGSGEPISK